MKLSYAIALASVGIVGAAGVFGVTGCSSSKSAAAGPVSGAGAPLPSVPSSAAATATTTWTNYAVNALFLGESDNGDTTFTPNQSAWATIGFDLDGIDTVSTEASNNCTPAGGGPVQTDGTDGIDNSFGFNVTPIISGLNYGSQFLTQSEIQKGAFTIMLNVQGIDPTNATQTASGLSAGVFAGGNYAADVDAGPPAFTSQTVWPVEPALLASQTPGTGGVYSSSIVFAKAGINAGEFVSGQQDIVLSLSLGGQNLNLTIHNAIITFQLESNGSAGAGIIGGILNISELKTELAQVGGSIDSGSFCSTIEGSIIPQLDSWGDIMTTGAAGGGESCDGISIGLGFTAAAIAQPTTLAPGADADAGAPVSCSAVDGG